MRGRERASESALREALEDAGIGDASGPIARVARPAARFVPTGEADRPARIGETKLGGEPDLPPHLAWPMFRDEPQAFIAQVDLAEAAKTGAVSDALPDHGVLAFFYDVAEGTWGFDPADAGACRVLWFEDAAALRRRALPEEMPEDGLFNECVMSLEPVRVPRGEFEADDLDHLIEDPRVERYQDFLDRWVGDSRQHQLLGHPRAIQDDEMAAECAMVTGGIELGNGAGFADPRAAALKASAGDWILLAQFDSDDEVGFAWGDTGRLYYWIRKQDLAARRFDRVWLILQCY